MSRVAFGEFVLDAESRELRRGRDAVALSPKAYELLQILVQSRPKALSKMALQERLWPDTFVVEKNLVNLVAEIRRALGDDPAQPRFVRTVHRFGYAFRESAEVSGAIKGGPAVARVHLQWADGRATLGDGEHVLGRDPDLEVFVDGPDVSRRHALIRISGSEVTIEDLGSKNGTFVDERPVESPTPLLNGMVIRLGAVRLMCRRALAPPGSTVSQSLRD